jgi:hypothetical protein
MTIFSFFSVCRFNFSFFILVLFSPMQLVYPRHVLMNTKTLLKETNLTMDYLINLELNAHQAVSPPFLPLLQIVIFLCCSTSSLVLQMVSAKLHFYSQHKRTTLSSLAAPPLQMSLKLYQSKLNPRRVLMKITGAVH